MAFVSKRRLVVVGLVLVLALAVIVGLLFGYLAGVAVVLAAVTIPLLALGAGFGVDAEARVGRAWGQNFFGPDNDRKR